MQTRGSKTKVVALTDSTRLWIRQIGTLRVKTVKHVDREQHVNPVKHVDREHRFAHNCHAWEAQNLPLNHEPQVETILLLFPVGR